MKMFYTLLPTCLICLLFLCANDQVQAQENANATLEFTSLTLGTPPASFIENGVTWGLSSTSSNFEVATSSGSNNLRLLKLTNRSQFRGQTNLKSSHFTSALLQPALAILL